ncbi:MAG TPA: GTPase HflX [Thermodesulfobacteriota bacterium]|nr:GTPase HflX [Thermodesulfobacteriota bacterium]
MKPNQIRRIEHIYRRKIPPQKVITPEIARLLSELSNEIRRQIGILVGRRGSVEFVIVGDQKGITIPDLSRYRSGILRLRGLRLIHTHLQGEPLTGEDLTDLAFLRLDMIMALNVEVKGPASGLIHSAHLLPDNPGKKVWEIDPPTSVGQLDVNFLKWIQSIEDEFQRGQKSIPLKGATEKAILISVNRESRESLVNSMEELKELAESSGVFVVDSIIQRPQSISPKTLMGEGKLKELLVKCMQLGVDLIIFDQNLTPGQMASISDLTELRVLDRTQLILDIFAQRAHTLDGKIQVELAQLKYLLPRLARKTLALSRLTGGIGRRGPGETKLEIDRRRVADRIHLLEKEIGKLRRRREQRRSQRSKTGIPILSIVGYTNAGKSTLFNLLTRSQFQVEDKLFSTLDTATRKLRFPKIHKVVITDTVGFIKDLPKDLMGAFRPTFDELRESDLLIHLIDISHPRFPEHIDSVEKILMELKLDHIPRLKVFNKEDKLSRQKAEAICQRHDGICISALRPESLEKFFLAVDRKLWEVGMTHSRESYTVDEMDNVRLTNRDSFDISNQNWMMEERGDDGKPSYRD